MNFAAFRRNDISGRRCARCELDYPQNGANPTSDPASGANTSNAPGKPHTTRPSAKKTTTPADTEPPADARPPPRSPRRRPDPCRPGTTDTGIPTGTSAAATTRNTRTGTTPPPHHPALTIQPTAFGTEQAGQVAQWHNADTAGDAIRALLAELKNPADSGRPSYTDAQVSAAESAPLADPTPAGLSSPDSDDELPF